MGLVPEITLLPTMDFKKTNKSFVPSISDWKRQTVIEGGEKEAGYKKVKGEYKINRSCIS